MNEETDSQSDVSHSEWPIRPWITAAILALCGLAVYMALDNGESYGYSDDPVRQAMAAFAFFGGLAAVFSLEKVRLQWSIIFALVAGLTLAGITWWVSDYNYAGFIWDWAFGAGLVALAIAVPLFQTAREAGGWQFSYDRLHFYSWTDVVIYFAALAFTGLSWLLLFLLDSLFQLIGIDIIRDLTSEEWFAWVFCGATFGAALGILRENDRILGTLQRVVLIVLSVLAPPFAFALVIFLVALLATGLDTLWEATKATTPILISCAIGAIILSNAIIRNNEAETSGSRILRISAMVLACTILPLAMIAAISVGLRLDQYGLTPERIWGLLVVIVAVAYGLAYIVSVIRGRTNWAQYVRPANTRLAIALCGIMLFLALPIMDFGALSARDQVARINSGETKAEDFDPVAMAFDFGPKGRELLKQLSENGPEALRADAKTALAAEDRWDARPENSRAQKRQMAATLQNIRTIPANMEISDDIAELIDGNNMCQQSMCVAKRISDEKYILVGNRYRNTRVTTCIISAPLNYVTPEKGELDDDHKAVEVSRYNNGLMSCGNFTDAEDKDIKIDKSLSDDAFEVRDVTRKQLYVDGKPIGDVFE